MLKGAPDQSLIYRLWVTFPHIRLPIFRQTITHFLNNSTKDGEVFSSRGGLEVSNEGHGWFVCFNSGDDTHGERFFETGVDVLTYLAERGIKATQKGKTYFPRWLRDSLVLQIMERIK